MRWIYFYVALALAPCLSIQSAEPKRLGFEPGKPLQYRIERVLTGTVKVFGDTQATDEKWVMDV